MPTPDRRRRLPRDRRRTQALSAYNAGVRLVEKADELSADAARQADERKQTKARDKARKAYSSALREIRAGHRSSSRTMYQAWNYLGYAQRKLGNYQDALARLRSRAAAEARITPRPSNIAATPISGSIG